MEAPPFAPDFARADAAAAAAVAGAGAAPLRVVAVDLRGLARTNRAVVEGVLANLAEPRTLAAVAETLHADHAALMALGAFAGVDLTLDDGGKPGEARVVATFDERPPLSLRAGTYVQGTEGTVELEASLINALGRAERVTLSLDRGAHALVDAAVTASRRAPAGLPVTLDVAAHARSRSWATTASFDEASKGVAASATSLDGGHALALEATWRRLVDATRHASAAVKAGAGHSLKAAARYTRRAGGTDGNGPAEVGAAARCVLEVTGLAPGPGLVRHVRASAAGSMHVPLGAGWGLELGGDVGALAPWGPPSRRAATPIPDRFFLGGFGSPGGALRGFHPRAVGPADARHVRAPTRSDDGGPPPPPPRPWDYLGGDVCASVFAALRFALPSQGLTAAGMYGHAFVGAGAIGLVSPSSGGSSSPAPRPAHGAPSSTSSLASSLAGVGAGWRASAGVGVVWPTAVGSLEVDWVAVLRAAGHDRARSGLQVGFAPRL